MSYTIGNTVRLSVEFRDSAGTLVDPTEVTCRVRSQRAAAAKALTVTRDAVGRYHADVTPDDHGTWAYRFKSTGDVVSSAEGMFTVDIPVSDFQ